MSKQEFCFSYFADTAIPRVNTYITRGGQKGSEAASLEFISPGIGPTVDLVSQSVRGGATGGYAYEMRVGEGSCAESVTLLPPIFGFGSRPDVFFDLFSKSEEKMRVLRNLLPTVTFSDEGIKLRVGVSEITTITRDGLEIIGGVKRAGSHRNLKIPCEAGHKDGYFLEVESPVKDIVSGSVLRLASHFDLLFNDPEQLLFQAKKFLADGVDEENLRDLIDVSFIINGIE